MQNAISTRLATVLGVDDVEALLSCRKGEKRLLRMLRRSVDQAVTEKWPVARWRGRIEVAVKAARSTNRPVPRLETGRPDEAEA